MENLIELQMWMLEKLQKPNLTNDFDIQAYLSSTGMLSTQASLAIYQRSYFARLSSCLQQQFPALYYCLGEETFNAFAGEYLRVHPSRSHTLHDLGENFVPFLQSTRPDNKLPPEQKEVWIDFMIELAGFERLAFIMFDAEGDEGQLITSKSSVPDNELQLQRCLYMYSANFPVADYYCKVRDENNPELPNRYQNFMVLVRVAFRTRIIPVTKLEYNFLKHFRFTGDIQQAILLTCASSQISTTEDELSELWTQSGGFRDKWSANGFFVRRDC